MMNLLVDIEIRCEKCGLIHVIPKDFLEPSVSSYERNMGDEIEYIIEDSIVCDECQNEIRFVIRGYEYPVGAYNYDDYEIFGGDFIQEPNMGIIYFQEEFDMEVAYGEYDRVRDLILQIVEDRDMIYNISPREFEEVVERVFISEGFETQLTKVTRDGGKDIIAIKYSMGKPIVFYVECKQYGRHRTVDVNIVRSLYGVQMSDQINKSVLITTSHFSRDAKEYAENQNTLIDLIDVDEFYELLKCSAKRI